MFVFRFRSSRADRSRSFSMVIRAVISWLDSRKVWHSSASVGDELSGLLEFFGTREIFYFCLSTGVHGIVFLVIHVVVCYERGRRPSEFSLNMRIFSS